MPLLRMVKITKRFPGVVALDEVSLELHAGEVLCLVGENGAGKSTLMRVLAGAHGSDSGEILIDGNVVELESPARARSLGIGMIHQDLRLVSELSVAENIMLGVEPTGASGILVDSRTMHRSAAVALHQLGEAIDTRIPAGSLSVAMQQLVAIAQAISRSVRILVLDEPTAPLTQHEIRGLFTVIRKLRDDGVGIVYISHRLEEVFEIADRIAVLRDGRLVSTTSAGELDRLAGRCRLLRDPPDLRVLERVLRVVLDLVDDARPAPRLVDRVEHRADRVREQRRARLVGLQLLVLEALPALQRVVMPGPSGDVLVEVVVARRENVEACALEIRDDHRVRIREALAEPRVHHGGVEGLPHRLTSYQRGRGYEPVIVAGSIRSFVDVNAIRLSSRSSQPAVPIISCGESPRGAVVRSGQDPTSCAW